MAAATSLVATLILFGCATGEKTDWKSDPAKYLALYKKPFFVSLYDTSNRHRKDIRHYCEQRLRGEYEYFNASTSENRGLEYYTCEMGDDSWAAVSNQKPRIRRDQLRGFIITIKAIDPLMAASEIERLRPIVKKQKAENAKRTEEEMAPILAAIAKRRGAMPKEEVTKIPTLYGPLIDTFRPITTTAAFTDNQGHLIGPVKTLETEGGIYYFDTDRRLIRVQHVFTKGSSEYAYSGDSELPFRVRIKGCGTCTAQAFPLNYDSNGNNKKFRIEKSIDGYTASMEDLFMTFDDKGNLVNIRHSINGNTFDATYQYKYSSDGRIVERSSESNNTNNDRNETTKLIWDERGRLIYYELGNNTWTYTNYQDDPSGNWITRQCVGTGGARCLILSRAVTYH